MPVELVPTAYGRPAVEALHAVVATAKAGDPLRPVTVVVPSNVVGVSVRRLLASGDLGPLAEGRPGVVGVTFVTVFRLAELLGAPRLAGAGRRPVSTPVVAAAVRAALAEEPGRFAPVAAHPATTAALVGAHRELAEVPQPRLDDVARTGPRAADVVRLHRAARRRLAEHWYDETDLLAAAATAVRAGAPLAADLGAVVLHLPQRLSPAAAELVAALADRTSVVIVAGRTGAADADAETDAALRRLGLTPPSAPAPSPAAGAPGGGALACGAATPGSPPHRTEVISAADAEDEVRHAVRRLLVAAADGVPLERCALLYPSSGPYARLVAEQFDAAGVPWNGAAVRPLADRLLGRWLLDVLALPTRGWRRGDLFAVLAGAHLRWRGRAVPVARWERASRAAGVVRGRAAWAAQLARFAERARAAAAAEEASAEPRDWLVRRRRWEAQDAEELGRFVDALAGRLSSLARAGSWASAVTALRELADELLGGEDRRHAWPAAEQAAADAVERALDRLAALDEVDAWPSAGPTWPSARPTWPSAGPTWPSAGPTWPSAGPTWPSAGPTSPSAGAGATAALELLAETLALELDTDLARVGRFGEGVLVGPLAAAVGVDLDVVVVLGLAEGVLPQRISEDSLLPDVERAAAAGDLPLRADGIATEHRHLLAALAAARQVRVLCTPRGDLRRSAERPPSRWLLDAAAQLQPGGARRLPASAPWLTVSPSFAGAVQRTPTPATAQEHALRVLADHTAAGGRLDDAPDVDAVLRRGAELVAARRSHAVTRFDGNVSGVRDLLPSPADGAIVSPTSLERWAECPLRYLVEVVLGVSAVENPEEVVSISPLDAGLVVHEALERWLQAQLVQGVPSHGASWGADARSALAAVASACCDEAAADGRTGAAVLWRRERRRLERELARFCDEDDRRRADTGLQPLAAEVPFGMEGRPPVEVELGDGRILRLRGKVDRLDVAADGTLVVVDYKTGKADGYKGLREDPVLAGAKLQLPVYALAARAHAGLPAAPVHAAYWFTSTRGNFDAVGYEVDDAVLDRFRTVLATIADGIAAGVFPARPAPPSAWGGGPRCSACDPDELGTGDRHRTWQRKRDDGFVAAYLALVEPAPAEVLG